MTGRLAAAMLPPASRVTGRRRAGATAARPGWRLGACVLPAAVVIGLSAAPAAQFTGWQWVSLALAGVVAVWGAWPVHRAAWRGLSRGVVRGDLTVSLGIAVALGWSGLALLFGPAGSLGLRQSLPWLLPDTGPAQLYLNAAVAASVSALAGRWALGRLAGPGTADETGQGQADEPAGAGGRLLGAAFVPCVVTVAGAALGFWLGAGMPAAAAWGAAAAVLVAACPAGVAESVAGLAARQGGARGGIEVRDPLRLETARRAGVVVLDGRLLSDGNGMRADAAEIVARIGAAGPSPIVVTGEPGREAGGAGNGAQTLGLPAERVVRAGPDEVARVVRELRDGGVAVAVAGDEALWAEALSEADLGIAVGPNAVAGPGGTARPRRVAGMGAAAGPGGIAGIGGAGAGAGGGCAVACGDVLGVAGVLRLAGATRAVAGAGARWTAGYNVIVVPVAAVGCLSPVLAAGAAAVTTALVLASGARLRRGP